MPRTPEKDALQGMCAIIVKTLASKCDLALFGSFISGHKFLSQEGVQGILGVGVDSKLAKASNLMMAVDTHITTTGSPEQTTKYFNEFVIILCEDLGLDDLAQQLVEKCQELARNV